MEEEGKSVKVSLYVSFTDFSFQISVSSLKFTTSQNFKVKNNCSKENEKRNRKRKDIFSHPEQADFDIDRAGGLIHHRSDVMGSQQ